MTLVPVVDGPAVVACTTCRLSARHGEDAQGRRGGALLVAALRAVQASDPRYAGIAVQEMACLFACDAHCAVHVRAPRRIGYVLGRFAPDDAAARAILDYARRHADSAEGEVDYADWPDGVKGHFLVRIPPAGSIVA